MSTRTRSKVEAGVEAAERSEFDQRRSSVRSGPTAGPSASGINEYEQQREDNIRRNRERMLALNLSTLSAEVGPSHRSTRSLNDADCTATHRSVSIRFAAANSRVPAVSSGY
eukprot:6686282-Pyramimonas_sp.AAC.1